MRAAREILQEYLDRRQADTPAGAPTAEREENLRRLLRHVGAARQPSATYEASLLAAIQREIGRRPPGHRLGRPMRPSWPAWQLLAPAAALAAGSLAFAWHSLHPRPAGAPTSLHTHPFPAPVATAPPSAPVAQPAPVMGYVLMASGELRRRHGSEARWEPVDSGKKIVLGDSLSTDASASGSIVFRDDSLCYLYPSSEIQLTGPAREGMTRPSVVRLARGATWNSVEKGGPPFMVRTAAAAALVHGTEFGVAVGAQGKTTVRVLQGVVELRAAQGSVLVGPGMQSAALPGRPPQPAIAVAALRKPPVTGMTPSGVLPAPPPVKKPEAMPEEPGAKTFHRTLPASPSAPGAGATPPGEPPQTSGSSASDSSDAPQSPITTSR